MYFLRGCGSSEWHRNNFVFFDFRIHSTLLRNYYKFFKYESQQNEVSLNSLIIGMIGESFLHFESVIEE
jgi:hypothetical protein